VKKIIFKTDCKYFFYDRPCVYHKEKRTICDGCQHYQPEGYKILLIKLGAIGDVLRTTSLLKPLKNRYKNSTLYWITLEESVPLLQNNPFVDHILVYDIQTFSRVLSEEFDLLINLDLTSDSLFLATLAKAKKKKGYGVNRRGKVICFNPEAGEWFALSHNDELKKKNKKTYQEHILKIVGIKKPRKFEDYEIVVNLTEEEKKIAQEFAQRNCLFDRPVRCSALANGSSHCIVGLNTGGGDKWKKKAWTVEGTVELIKLLSNNRRTTILLFGGNKEKERNNKIKFRVQSLKFGKNIIDTGTDNTLRQFIALVNLCDVVVATDTLALHVALGLKKKVVALFGPTSVNEIEMYGLGKKILSPIDCAVCYNQKCAKKPDCMDLIKPEKVYKTITAVV